jgi:hypothetical protein
VSASDVTCPEFLDCFRFLVQRQEPGVQEFVDALHEISKKPGERAAMREAFTACYLAAEEMTKALGESPMSGPELLGVLRLMGDKPANAGAMDAVLDLLTPDFKARMRRDGRLVADADLDGAALTHITLVDPETRVEDVNAVFEDGTGQPWTLPAIFAARDDVPGLQRFLHVADSVAGQPVDLFGQDNLVMQHAIRRVATAALGFLLRAPHLDLAANAHTSKHWVLGDAETLFQALCPRHEGLALVCFDSFADKAQTTAKDVKVAIECDAVSVVRAMLETPAIRRTISRPVRVRIASSNMYAAVVPSTGFQPDFRWLAQNQQLLARDTLLLRLVAESRDPAAAQVFASPRLVQVCAQTDATHESLAYLLDAATPRIVNTSGVLPWLYSALLQEDAYPYMPVRNIATMLWSPKVSREDRYAALGVLRDSGVVAAAVPRDAVFADADSDDDDGGDNGSGNLPLPGDLEALNMIEDQDEQLRQLAIATLQVARWVSSARSAWGSALGRLMK